MSGPAESALEAEPLKSGPEEESVSNDRGCGGQQGVSKLSGWRTAAFLLSLFICLIIVFAFSFILPCPVRPQYQRTWSRRLPAAATYDFLAVGDANRDKVQDVFFIYKSAEGTMNQTCISEGLRSPCLFLLAVDGTDGETLWERPLAAVFDWADCEVGGAGTKEATCLVAHADNLTAVNINTGVIVWQKPLIKGRLPVIHLPDLDGDGTDDIAVLSYYPVSQSLHPVPTELVFFSVKSGEVIGSKVEGAVRGMRTHLQAATPSGAQYLLLLTDAGLYAVGLWRFAEGAGITHSRLKKEISWERKINNSGHIPLYESESLQNVLVVLGGSASSSHSLLLQTASTVMLLNTDTLGISWTKNTSQLISIPSFGHYNKDKVSDIVLEEYLGNATKRVVIVDGQTGRELWVGKLPFISHSPRPASVLTIYSYSVFMMWGEIRTQSNETSVISEEWASYLLHPQYSSVLMERRNPVQNIISFKTALLERGRHACYLLLTGADGSLTDEAMLDGAGSVVLTKRKIKDDVSDSVVVGVGGPDGEATSKDTEGYVREAFNRLRFNEEII